MLSRDAPSKDDTLKRTSLMPYERAETVMLMAAINSHRPKARRVPLPVRVWKARIDND